MPLVTSWPVCLSPERKNCAPCGKFQKYRPKSPLARPRPHVSLVKIRYVEGSKKSKRAANKLASEAKIKERRASIGPLEFQPILLPGAPELLRIGPVGDIGHEVLASLALESAN